MPKAGSTRLILNSSHHLLITLFFCHFLHSLLCSFSYSQSLLTGNLSSRSSSAVSVLITPAHLSCQCIWTGRFPKRKKYGGSFHSRNSHLISSQYSTTAPASPYMDSAGREALASFVRHSAPKSSGRSCWTAVLDPHPLLPGFLQEEQHILCIVSVGVFSHLSNSCITHRAIPPTAASDLHSNSHCISLHSFFTRFAYKFVRTKCLH